MVGNMETKQFLTASISTITEHSMYKEVRKNVHGGHAKIRCLSRYPVESTIILAKPQDMITIQPQHMAKKNAIDTRMGHNQHISPGLKGHLFKQRYHPLMQIVETLSAGWPVSGHIPPPLIPLSRKCSPDIRYGTPGPCA